MKIEEIEITKLSAAAYNPRTISQHEFESLQRSIDHFGFVEPVVVNKRNMRIVGGHMRVRAAAALAFKTVPVTFVELSDKHEKALNVALNKISGAFDNDQLAELLHTLDDESFDLTGFTTEELEALQDGFVEHDEEGPVDKAKTSYSLKDLREERDRFSEALGRGDNGFVEWLATKN